MADSGANPKQRQPKKNKKKRKQSGPQESERPPKTNRTNSSENENEPQDQNFEVGKAEKPNQGGPWRNLELILSIQNRELDLHNECEGYVALLEAYVRVLLYCLETLDAVVVAREGFFSWEVEEGVTCACFLRRIYEELRHQKEVFGPHCYHFLAYYIRVYSGYGPRKTGIKREIDEALRPGAYALIDVCSPDDLQRLHTTFGEGPCRNTLATLKHDYELNFQYQGKV